MAVTPFFTPELIEQISEKFSLRLERDPDFPLSPRSIETVLREDLNIREGWPAKFKLHTLPKLTTRIDTKCKVRLGKVAPMLGALGKLLKRNVDGTFVEPRIKPGVKPKATAEPDLGGGPLPASHGTNGSNGTNGHAPHTASGKRVFWTDEDRQMLCLGVMEEFQTRPEGGITFETFTKAMHKLLPQEKWRTLNSRAAVGEESFARVTKAARELMAKALMPPPPPEVQVVEREVSVPVDINKLLDEVPLPVLLGVCMRRGAEVWMKAGGLSSLLPKAPPAAAVSPETPVPASAIDVKALEAEVPHVQIIGARPFNDRTIRDRLKYFTVVLEPSIDPATPVDATKLSSTKGCIYIINAHDCPQPWRDFLLKKFPEPERRMTYTDIEKVCDHIKKIAEKFAQQHPVLTEAWKATRQLC